MITQITQKKVCFSIKNMHFKETMILTHFHKSDNVFMQDHIFMQVQIHFHTFIWIGETCDFLKGNCVFVFSIMFLFEWKQDQNWENHWIILIKAKVNMCWWYCWSCDDFNNYHFNVNIKYVFLICKVMIVMMIDAYNACKTLLEVWRGDHNLINRVWNW